jgi:hypothetical protein
MTTSGTYAYQLLSDELLTEAWERCGKSPAVLNAEAARSARRSLQLTLIHWTNIGVPLWQVEQVTSTLAAGQQTLTLSAEVADVLDAYVTISGNDRYLGRIGRTDYTAISNKTVSAPPSQIWVQRVLPAAIVTFYPVPDQSYPFTAWCLRQPQDVSALYQSPEAPVLWSEALAAELARRMAVKFAPDRLALLAQDAKDAFAAARTENRERVPLTILPDFSGY